MRQTYAVRHPVRQTDQIASSHTITRADKAVLSVEEWVLSVRASSMDSGNNPRITMIIRRYRSRVTKAVKTEFEAIEQTILSLNQRRAQFSSLSAAFSTLLVSNSPR